MLSLLVLLHVQSDFCASNGHTCSSADLTQQLRGRKRGRPSNGDCENIVSGLSPPESQDILDSACGMSVDPVANGNSHSKETVEDLGQSPSLPLSRRSVSDTSASPDCGLNGGSSSKGQDCQLTACLDESPMLKDPLPVAAGLQNGFHRPSSSRGVPCNGLLSSTMAPCGDDHSQDMAVDRGDIVSPIIAPPSLPDFTPLSPRSSPQRSSTPIAAPPTLSHQVSSVASLQTCSMPVCSITAIPSLPSDSALRAEPTKASTAREARPCVAPVPVMTPSGSPLVLEVDAAAVVSTPSQPTPCTEALTTSASECSSASDLMTGGRQEQATASGTADLSLLSSKSVPDTSFCGRPKRKKLDGGEAVF